MVFKESKMAKKTRYLSFVIAITGLVIGLFLGLWFYYQPLSSGSKQGLSPQAITDELDFTSVEKLLDWSAIAQILPITDQKPAGFRSALQKKHIHYQSHKTDYYYLLEFSDSQKALFFYLQNSLNEAVWQADGITYHHHNYSFAQANSFVGILAIFFAALEDTLDDTLRLHQKALFPLGGNLNRLEINKSFTFVEWRELNWSVVSQPEVIWLQYAPDFGLFMFSSDLFSQHFSPIITERTFNIGSYSALQGRTHFDNNMLYLRHYSSFVTLVPNFTAFLTIEQKLLLRRFL